MGSPEEHLKKYRPGKYERDMKYREINLKKLKRYCKKFNVLYINFGIFIGKEIGRKYCFPFDGDNVFAMLFPPKQDNFTIEIQPKWSEMTYHLLFSMQELERNDECGISIIGFDSKEERDLYVNLTEDGKDELY